jgi:hypothetical protein
LQERQAFAALLGSLCAGEQAKSWLAISAYDLLLGPRHDGQFTATQQGVLLSELSAAQRQLALQAIMAMGRQIRTVSSTIQ